MILMKAPLVDKIRTCLCGHDVDRHCTPGSRQVCLGDFCFCHKFVGQKTSTRRMWKAPRVKVGSVHRVNIDYRRWTGLSIKILSVALDTRIDMISEDDARSEGFPSVAAFRAYFDAINRKRDLSGRKCFVVDFELAQEVDDGTR